MLATFCLWGSLGYCSCYMHTYSHRQNVPIDLAQSSYSRVKSGLGNLKNSNVLPLHSKIIRKLCAFIYNYVFMFN